MVRQCTGSHGLWYGVDASDPLCTELIALLSPISQLMMSKLFEIQKYLQHQSICISYNTRKEQILETWEFWDIWSEWGPTYIPTVLPPLEHPSKVILETSVLFQFLWRLLGKMAIWQKILHLFPRNMFRRRAPCSCGLDQQTKHCNKKGTVEIFGPQKVKV